MTPIEISYNSILELVKAMDKPKPTFYTLIATESLKGTQTIIISGDKAYYSPDMATGEVKILEIPEEMKVIRPIQFSWESDDILGTDLFTLKNDRWATFSI